MGRRRLDVQPLLRYATIDEAPLYRAIMEVFTEAAAGYASRISPEEVHAALTVRLTPSEEDSDSAVPTLAEVSARLERLCKWGNLSQDNDASRATSLDAYGRTAYVYDLTPGGEAAAEALATLEDGLRRVGGLQGVALRQIEEMLAELVDTFRVERRDGERAYAICEDLHTRFKGLTANAALFMQKVNKLLNSPVVEVSEFALFKADTITYLDDFISDLDTLAARIRLRLDAFDRIPPETRKAALAAAEAASGQLALDDAAVVTWAARAEARLTGLAEWFRAGPDARIGAAVLYEKTRDAILGITRVAERIREASSSPSSRSADLLDLAGRFERAAGDDEGHVIWHAAFGLASARHLGLTGVGSSVPASTSWWDEASQVPISRQLRATGRTDYVRRATNVTDRGAAKRNLAAATHEAQRRSAGASEVLIGIGVVRVSEINDRLSGPLDPGVLRLLASLLTRAMRSRRRRDGTRLATSVDGRLQITVREPSPPHAARLVAGIGTWTLPDYEVFVEACAHARAAERAAADLAGRLPESAAGR